MRAHALPGLVTSLLAALLLLTAALPAAATSSGTTTTQLMSSQVGASSEGFQEEDDCGGRTSGVVWHFVLNGVEGTETGTLTASFGNGEEHTVQNGAPRAAKPLHFYVGTGEHTTVQAAEATYTGSDGDEMLVLSHVCDFTAATDDGSEGGDGSEGDGGGDSSGGDGSGGSEGDGPGGDGGTDGSTRCDGPLVVTVVDEDGDAQPDVAVTVDGTTTRTDADGRASFATGVCEQQRITLASPDGSEDGTTTVDGRGGEVTLTLAEVLAGDVDGGSGGGATDEGTDGGGSSDGGSSDGGSTSGGDASDDGSSGGASSDGATSGGGSSDGGASTSGTSGTGGTAAGTTGRVATPTELAATGTAATLLLLAMGATLVGLGAALLRREA